MHVRPLAFSALCMFFNSQSSPSICPHRGLLNLYLSSLSYQFSTQTSPFLIETPSLNEGNSNYHETSNILTDPLPRELT